MAEDTKDELVPVADYEVLDQVDDQAIIEMMTGQAIQDYVYSFRQGGKTVEGLTLAGINEAANRRGGIQVDEIQHEEREHSWLVIVKATDALTGSSRYGAYEQAKRAGSRPDPFAFTKAVHKAQRNAIKQLLPVPVIKEVLNFYLHRKTQPDQSQMELPMAARNDKITNAQKAAFVMASKLEKQLEGQGVTKSDFWAYVKRRYAVESRNDMTEFQWTELSAELKGAESSPQLFKQLMDRMRQLDAASKSSEVPETPEPTPTSDGNPAKPQEAEVVEAEDMPF
ncbi:MAG: hypothetical protein O7E52_11715 [Candidatus Poribacteria bacterium]|nr:hypothetical protein [Candidatus Poribacteria bacterium]